MHDISTWIANLELFVLLVGIVEPYLYIFFSHTVSFPWVNLIFSLQNVSFKTSHHYKTIHTERRQARQTVPSETYLEKHICACICSFVLLVVATLIKSLDSQFHWEKHLSIIRNLKWDWICFSIHFLILHMTPIN